mgnify:CR=1 FL=1
MGNLLGDNNLKYRNFFRKSSFKKDIHNGNLLLNLIYKYKPVNFLEVGVLEGATSRNICEVLNHLNNNKFNFIGIDLFRLDYEKNNAKEFTPISNKISNPIKWLYFKIILRSHPNSIKSVEHLLRKFKDSTKFYQGYSDDLLNKIKIDHIDFVFLDGGHSYETVKCDLELLIIKLKSGSIILCDDYNIEDYGVKKAVDEIKSNHYFEDLGRFSLLRIDK